MKSPVSGSVFYNLLFVMFQLIYNYFLRGIILGESSGAIYGSHKSPLLGILLLLAIAGGTYSIMIRCRMLRIENPALPGVPAFIIWVMNWVIVIFMVFTAVKSFGINISSDTLTDRENKIIIAAILSAMADAGIVLAFLARMSVPYHETISRAKAVTGQLLAFIFCCVSYTAVWETIMFDSISREGTYEIFSANGIFMLGGWITVFLLLYPPMRFPFILQELHDFKNGRNRPGIAAGYVLVFITGLLPLVKL